MGCSGSSIDVAEERLADRRGSFPRKPRSQRSQQLATPSRAGSPGNIDATVGVARAPAAPARPVKPIAPPSPLPPGLPKTGLQGDSEKGHESSLRETATAVAAARPIAPTPRSPVAPSTSGLVLLNPQRPAQEPQASGVDGTTHLAEKSRSSPKELAPLRAGSRPGTGKIASRPGTSGTGVSWSGAGSATLPGTGTSVSSGIASPSTGGHPASRPATVASTTASTIGLLSPSALSSRGTCREDYMTDLIDEIEVAEDKAVAFELEGWMTGMRKTLLLEDDGLEIISRADGINLCNTMDAIPTSHRIQALMSGDDELLMQQILEDSEDCIQDESALF